MRACMHACARACLGVDLVQAADADDEQQAGLRLNVEAALGLGLALQADDLALLCAKADA